MSRKIYWQSIRGICIIAVVLIHSIGGIDNTMATDTGYMLGRKLINFAVAVFVFMSGFFVNVKSMASDDFSYVNWLKNRGGRLAIPFVLWSLFYSGVSIVQSVLHGEHIGWMGYAYRFSIGKSATPFYYIIVLFQLTLITPWLVRTVQQKGMLWKILWLITPTYLIFLYSWNYITRSEPPLYETFFPAWFCFYYLGINVKCGMKMVVNIGFVMVALILSCIESILLRRFGMSQSFYISQITVGSFLYSISIIGFVLKRANTIKIQTKLRGILAQIGDCSYGIFYIHMFVLMIVGKVVGKIGAVDNCFLYWRLRFVLTVLLSYWIVRVGKSVLEKRKRLLSWVGFI